MSAFCSEKELFSLWDGGCFVFEKDLSSLWDGGCFVLDKEMRYLSFGMEDACCWRRICLLFGMKVFWEERFPSGV